MEHTETSCKECIWADKCSCSEICEYYETATTERENAKDDYELELKARYELYIKNLNTAED